MTRHPDLISPVSFLAHVQKLPRSGLPVVIEADERQRAALALDHDLLSVDRWRAELLVTAWKRQGVKVSGTVTADIVQTCVVTLDPLAARVDAEVEGLYFREDSRIGRDGFAEGGEIVLDPEGEDAPETFSGSTLDVGLLAEQFFGLAIDPYPRKPGAAIDEAPVDDDEAVVAPFAKLAALKPKS